jgi:putative ABC transport system substrate-binding protein
LLPVHSVFAQQPTKTQRIGVLFGTSRSFNATRIETFRQSLRELSWVEGKNVLIDHRYADGKLDVLPALAAELVQLKVDVIVTSATSGVLAAKNASGTIPIVFTALGDPVGVVLSSVLLGQAGTSRD